jgi:C4-type Zn-finger protein
MEKRDSFLLKFLSSKVRNEDYLYIIEIIVSSFECEECGFKNNEV